ncbi:uncharacterized protein LOC126847874 [Adelges cooleyi]|uniref:uncharacterized protein LOC126847874 n=1 Tax=Adelges cooleyi TaxID=133065 RepID=UPI0021807782|nr:uncharacterized protein LOC126847874 [Adelges cooleyi]
MSGYGKKEIRILPRRHINTVDTQLISAAVFTVNLNERKFIHIGCEWSQKNSAYKQAILIVCATACLCMEHDKFIGLLGALDNLIKIMTDDTGNDGKRAVIPIPGLAIKKTRCFSNSYMVIEYAGNRISLTKDNLTSIKRQREIMRRAVTEKSVISEMLTDQCKSLINVIRTEVIIRYLTAPIQGVYNIIINWPINLMPRKKHPLYKELLIYDHQRIVAFIWDEYLRSLSAEESTPQSLEAKAKNAPIHSWDFQRLFDDVVDEDYAGPWKSGDDDDGDDDGDAADQSKEGNKEKKEIRDHLTDVSKLIEQIDKAAAI